MVYQIHQALILFVGMESTWLNYIYSFQLYLMACRFPLKLCTSSCILAISHI